MVIYYDDDDLDLILLFSLLSSFVNFGDTLLYSHDTLTLDEVSKALHAKEKMKHMVIQNFEVREINYAGIHYKLKNKEKKSATYREKGKSNGKGNACILILISIGLLHDDNPCDIIGTRYYSL
ncbi:hypothetical protein ACJX0J_009469, partial [Zea mays]